MNDNYPIWEQGDQVCLKRDRLKRGTVIGINDETIAVIIDGCILAVPAWELESPPEEEGV